MTFRLYFLQRLTAALLVPLIAAHVLVIFLAIGQGLSAAEILSRTRGSLAWGAFYTAFVLLAGVHGAIGLRAVLQDWVGGSPRRLDVAMWAVGFVLVVLGLRAVAAVVVP